MPALSFTRTRLAPTPSGFLHLGNVLSFAITAALARKTGAKILLRIDDLDRQRVQPAYVRDIFDTLRFLGIPWDEGPHDYREYGTSYSQLHRMDIYREALRQLKESGEVFACGCSRRTVAKDNAEGFYPGYCRDKALPLNKAAAQWRLRTTATKELSVKIFPGTVTKAVLPRSMQSFVVKKKDGFPAYQLTSVVDDLHFGVDLVVRGADLWPSTLAQHYLAGSLHVDDFCRIAFFHHPLLKEGGEKLSKSGGSTSIQFLRKQGKKAEEIYAMISHRLGCKMPAHDWGSLAAATGMYDQFFPISTTSG